MTKESLNKGLEIKHTIERLKILKEAILKDEEPREQITVKINGLGIKVPNESFSSLVETLDKEIANYTKEFNNL